MEAIGLLLFCVIAARGLMAITEDLTAASWDGTRGAGARAYRSANARYGKARDAALAKAERIPAANPRHPGWWLWLLGAGTYHGGKSLSRRTARRAAPDRAPTDNRPAAGDGESAGEAPEPARKLGKPCEESYAGGCTEDGPVVYREDIDPAAWLCRAHWRIRRDKPSRPENPKEPERTGNKGDEVPDHPAPTPPQPRESIDVSPAMPKTPPTSEFDPELKRAKDDADEAWRLYDISCHETPHLLGNLSIPRERQQAAVENERELHAKWRAARDRYEYLKKKTCGRSSPFPAGRDPSTPGTTASTNGRNLMPATNQPTPIGEATNLELSMQVARQLKELAGRDYEAAEQAKVDAEKRIAQLDAFSNQLAAAGIKGPVMEAVANMSENVITAKSTAVQQLATADKDLRDAAAALDGFRAHQDAAEKLAQTGGAAKDTAWYGARTA